MSDSRKRSRPNMDSPVRPARRAARNKIIVEESEDELSLLVDEKEEGREKDEEFTPAPKRSPRKSTRRQTTANADGSPKKPGRPRKVKTGDSIEPSVVFDQNQTAAAAEPMSPTKRKPRASSPRKRSSVQPSRSVRQSSGVPPTPSLPTPAPSASPGSEKRHATPLADITSKAVNRPTDLPDVSEKPPGKPFSKLPQPEPVLDKPLDVAVRTKAEEVVTTRSAEIESAPKSRMVIRQLVMTNFKSYAGRQVVGPFHHSFSSVVGPNGSGKSNVIDSLLFVFGFRASKMRQGKISALIHNSAQHQDLDFCEVEVHFQEVIDLPGGKSEIVTDSQMVVSRKAFKNNSSTYYLNGRTTNFTAVTTLLKDKGIDLDHKRFLILQGEVESIAQMKPKAANEHDDGLLEYLEDIIGTSKYKTPIEEAATELETLNEVCVEKQGRVQHVEKERNGLEDKKSAALAFIRDENDLAEKQSTLYQIYLAECQDNSEVTEEAIAQMQAQLDAELSKHEGNENSIKQLEKEYGRAVKQFEQVEKQTQDFLKELAKYDKENVKFEEKRKFISGKQKKADKHSTASRLAAAEASSLAEKHSDDIERKTAEVAGLEQNMQTEQDKLATVRAELTGKTQGLSDEIATRQKSLEPWNEKISQKQSALAVSRSELEILNERAGAGQKAIAKVGARVGELESLREEKTGEIEQRQHERHRLEKDVRKIQDALRKLTHSEPEVRTQISSARQKAAEARASLSTTQNQGNVLKGLLRLRESGRVEGFYGRLGNLGAIDDRFDVAISTACPALENMVVESVEVGQQCIEYLRKNNLGRANFILLDRLPKRDMSSISTPENVPRLFDLIKVKDQKFAPAFFSTMQNTLVADDLEQANRIAYGAKRWRVVTLDGQLIDVSGTMSGGGQRVARGAMSSKLAADVTKEQVDKLETERDQLETQFGAFLEKQKELETSLREKQEEIPRLETVIQKLTLEVENCSQNILDAQRRMQELTEESNSSQTDKTQIQSLERQIAKTEKEVEELRAETASAEADIQRLQDKIMEVGGIQLRSQKGRVDGLKEQIDLLNDEISSAEIAKVKNEKLKVKHEKAKADAERELEVLDKDLEKLEADVQDQRSVAAESKARAEQAQDTLATQKEEMQSLKKDLDLKTTELNATRVLEIEMRNKLEENQKILADNEKKSRYWSDKLSKLTLHDIEDLDEPIVKQPKEGPTSNDHASEDDAMDVDGNDDSNNHVGKDGEGDTEMSNSDTQVGRPKPNKRLPEYTRDELQDKSKDRLVAAIAALEEKIGRATGVDLSVIAEYRRRCHDLAVRNADLNAALKTRDAAKTRLTDLRSLRLTQFMTGFTTISQHLKQMYQLITLGGNAELELVDSLDPFSEGILFSVMPPKKSWKNIGNLSGGEKTLSSLALVFALHVYRPTPLYVMDEIDAALDFRNVSIVAGYIKERTKNAQFIVISLRNNMFELAERLIGIYKVNHMTKSVTVDNRDYIRRT